MAYLNASLKNTFTAIIAVSAFAFVSCGNNINKTSRANSNTAAANNQSGSESGNNAE